MTTAEQIARRAHAGQTRRDGTPYIVHPERVAACVKDPRGNAVAWLHDVLEDTPVTAAELLAAGVPGEVVEAVECLSKRPEEEYPDFIARLRNNPLAVQVKLADICDNLNDTPSEKQVRKYSAALRFLLFDI